MEAENLYQRALDIRKQALGEEHPAIANSLHTLARLYHTQGKTAKAEPLYQQALSILLKKLGSQHPDVKTVEENYEHLRKEMGQKIESSRSSATNIVLNKSGKAPPFKKKESRF
ncbi:tetratricopeptide repeat protein [Candidatus Venteria ishoeyi]|uniref:tetratricopeptide repeat protein n=1 Tax=Candidatus Venteria ishoeyi TaxID=1899563 RepID=UPI0025A53C12|nr:tetratricopeptide repeat protein [Candidatus Venteria ishoeyi]MDM8547761.1 tetratricopeptide repeat protein [Candidatus Venteria ishoeyi]